MSSHLSVVIPAYNEEQRLPRSLASALVFLKRQTYASEIIVSDDGSKDRTAAVARESLQGFPHQVLVAPENRGKGHAVRQGIKAAQGKYVLYTDADFSTPIEEVTRFLEYLEKGQDIVIGSRALPGSKVEVHQNLLRETMGRIYNLFARILSFHDIHDSQCGFKCFRGDVARDLFGRQMLNGFSFEPEIIYLAQKIGYRVREEPVIWRNSAQSRVRLIADSLQMFCDLLKIRWIHRNTKL
jgi:dolichyl-phosphate beta-glucosyltransferase